MEFRRERTGGKLSRDVYREVYREVAFSLTSILESASISGIVNIRWRLRWGPNLWYLAMRNTSRWEDRRFQSVFGATLR